MNCCRNQTPVEFFLALYKFFYNEGVENNGETGGQDLTSRFSAPQLSGFTTLPKGMLQIMCFAVFEKRNTTVTFTQCKSLERLNQSILFIKDTTNL